MTAEPPDFRVRVAAERRERMRARLLQATMEVFGAENAHNAVIDDVIGAAGVSRGAFYRYFPSLNEALATLVSDLVAEIMSAAHEAFAAEPRAILRAALGSQLLLHRAAMDKPWARFVSGTNLLLDDAALTQVIAAALKAGKAQGAFSFDSPVAAQDIFLGILLAGVRRLAKPAPAPKSYLTDLGAHLLTSLGAGAKDAREAVGTAQARIREIGPVSWPWWRPPHA